MFHLTFLGGSEIRVKDRDNLVVTVWGGTDIFMPTLAEKMMRLREVKQRWPNRPLSETLPRYTNVFTLWGGTSFKLPTFAREILEMVQLKDSALMPEEELFELWQEAAKREDFDVLEVITIMGGAGEDRPTAEEESSDLQLLVLKGVITSQEFLELKHFISAEGTALLKSELQQKLRQYVFPARTASSNLGSSRPLYGGTLLKE